MKLYDNHTCASEKLLPSGTEFFPIGTPVGIMFLSICMWTN